MSIAAGLLFVSSSARAQYYQTDFPAVALPATVGSSLGHDWARRLFDDIARQEPPADPAGLKARHYGPAQFLWGI